MLLIFSMLRWFPAEHYEGSCESLIFILETKPCVFVFIHQTNSLKQRKLIHQWDSNLDWAVDITIIITGESYFAYQQTYKAANLCDPLLRVTGSPFRSESSESRRFL